MESSKVAGDHALIAASTKAVARLFVYGTLMEGKGNHHLLEGCEKVGRAHTAAKYAMFSAGIPFVNPTEEISTIAGEVYDIPNEEILKEIDRLEGHPDWYIRRACEVVLDDFTSDVLSADIYFNNLVSSKPDSVVDAICILSGDFRDAAKYGDPGH